MAKEEKRRTPRQASLPKRTLNLNAILIKTQAKAWAMARSGTLQPSQPGWRQISGDEFALLAFIARHEAVCRGILGAPADPRRAISEQMLGLIAGARGP